ncbi:putative nitrogen fixation protein NifT [Paraburkholderia diazotrophica]|uniref:putative nitrogen fixation protein NifT n=1 Tax=Paraburkholderia diazotrophica TaxID=667676 RepID=UPI00317559A8
MKVTIRRDRRGALTAYVPKKDVEETIVSVARAHIWGGIITLANGWQLELPEMAPDTVLPVTVEARRVTGKTD